VKVLDVGRSERREKGSRGGEAKEGRSEVEEGKRKKGEVK
jgi:hypothetical protein